MTKQVNLFKTQPNLVKHAGEITAICQSDEDTKIAIYENIVRASGGGEPRDQGYVQMSDGQKIDIQSVEKAHGLTWLSLGHTTTLPVNGQLVTVCLNAEHRQNRRKLHTASHILIRTALNYLDDDTSVKLADIAENADSAVVELNISRPFKDSDLFEIDKLMRSVVLQERPVVIAKAKSMEDAIVKHGDLLRVSDPGILKGRLRLLVIEGYDVNPCSGLHHDTTNIGPYSLSFERCDAHSYRSSVRLYLRLLDTWNYWYGSTSEEKLTGRAMP